MQSVVFTKIHCIVNRVISEKNIHFRIESFYLFVSPILKNRKV